MGSIAHDRMGFRPTSATRALVANRGNGHLVARPKGVIRTACPCCGDVAGSVHGVLVENGRVRADYIATLSPHSAVVRVVLEVFGLERGIGTFNLSRDAYELAVKPATAEPISANLERLVRFAAAVGHTDEMVAFHLRAPASQTVTSEVVQEEMSRTIPCRAVPAVRVTAPAVKTMSESQPHTTLPVPLEDDEDNTTVVRAPLPPVQLRPSSDAALISDVPEPAAPPSSDETGVRRRAQRRRTHIPLLTAFTIVAIVIGVWRAHALLPEVMHRLQWLHAMARDVVSSSVGPVQTAPICRANESQQCPSVMRLTS